MTWDSMTDRERDAWFAVVLFGWRSDADTTTCWDRHLDGRVRHKDSCPHYTTDANAALEVVEAMRQRGFTFDASLDDDGPLWWKVSLCNYSVRPRMDECMAFGKTFPLAVCAAAFEAMGVAGAACDALRRGEGQ